MSTVPRHRAAIGPALSAPRIRFRPLAVLWALTIVAVTAILVFGRLSVTADLVLGNAGVGVALLFSAVACLRAAWLKKTERRGWAWMAVAMAMGALGQLVFTQAVITGATETSSQVSDAIGYLGYSLPAVVALFLFPKPQESWISRFRSLLDAAVITVGIVLVGEATVLHRVRATVDLTTLDGLSGLAFPIVDLAICAVVLTLGMRQPPANRLAWLCLGAGLVSLAVTDSIYVVLRADTMANLTGTALAAGWMAAPVLVGLATLVPTTQGRHGWDFALPGRLVPYIPVLAALIVVGDRSVRDDRFLLVEFALLLLTVAVRQVMIVYENLTLTRDLESKVAARTAELATFGSIVTSSTDAIVGISSARIVTAYNPAAERLYGHRAADMIGRSPSFMSPAEAAGVQELLDSSRRGEQLSGYEVDWVRPDGTTVPVAMTVSPVLAGGEVQGISIIGQDITARRQIADSLEQARQEALESSRLKSEFLATMSHEIRTPMNGVIGLTSLLIETDLDAMQRKYAEGVRSAGQALIDVINDILDFSKLEAGKVVIEADDFDLRGLIEEVGNLLAPTAFAQGLELLVSCPPEAPAIVRGDRVRIRQILLNLASNAVKFTPAGEVTVQVEARPADGGRVRLRFEVVDTGIGIAAKDQPRLFESFTQADASTTRRFGGTGLGLAICRRLVEVMGGTIGLHSELGAGSTFWFEIPLVVGLSGGDPPLLPRHDLLQGLRVLVVDDNANTRTILDAQLTSWRMQPDLTDNGTEALQQLLVAEASGAAYDLAILDLMMPDVDGLELARSITELPTLSGLPMVMLTSAQRPSTAALTEAGIGQWLTKPVSSSELYDRLMRLLAPRSTLVEPLPEPIRKPAPTTAHGRILVVEDNGLNQLVAAGLVSRLGYEVDAVDNGLEALAALAAGSYVAVLMDCHMPVMDGFAATREIRRRQAGAIRTPVIALTAGALASDREQCLAAGMDDYIAKPVDLEALETVLSRWVGGRGVGGRWVGGRQPDEMLSAPANPISAADQSPIDWSRVAVLQGLPSPDGSSLISTFIATFASRGANRLASLRRAVQAGDGHDLTLAAHELKGSASTIGAVRVATICGLLERAGREGRAVAPELLDELDLEFDRAAAALADLVTPLPAS